MRLATFTRSPSSRTGLLVAGNRILDTGVVATQVGVSLPFDSCDMVSLQGKWDSMHVGGWPRPRPQTPSRLRPFACSLRFRAPRKNVFWVGWNLSPRVRPRASATVARRRSSSLPGDVLETEIDSIGILRNPVVATG